MQAKGVGRDLAMFEYEVVPVLITRGANGAAAGEEWQNLRTTLNQHGRRGFRVVVVTDGPEGRAVIMERRHDQTTPPRGLSVSQAAEQITWESARGAQ
jgi:hypothetical protein